MLPHCLFFIDVDGVMTRCSKIFQCTYEYGEYHDRRWFKEFTDRDSWALLRMKKEVVFISNDPKNEYYVRYKKHKFLYAPHSKGDKFKVLKEYWNKQVKSGSVLGDLDKPCYIYIGDGMFDYQCLVNAQLGFIPADADMLLVRKLIKEDKLSSWARRKITQLHSKGGEGCLLEAVCQIYDRKPEKLSPIMSNMQIFKEIGEYLG